MNVKSFTMISLLVVIASAGTNHDWKANPIDGNPSGQTIFYPDSVKDVTIKPYTIGLPGDQISMPKRKIWKS